MSTNLVWLIILGVLIFLYFPIASFQFGLMIDSIIRPAAKTVGQNVENRRVIVVICTNGQNPDVVESILREIKSYRLSIEQFVIKETNDNFRYSAQEIVVPATYATRNGSRKKMRALHYGIEELHRMGFGSETYICHLDDDSVVDKGYLEHIYSMEEEGGQGAIRLREYNHHLFSALADMGRVFTCDVLCRHFNSIGRPMEVHGEGLTVRADVEFEIGWDFGTYGAEDLMMGQLIVKKGFRFGFIPHHVFIAPPTNARDFYKQRRRWAYSLLWSVKEIREIRPAVLYWLVYRYGTTWTGFTGLLVLPYTLSPFSHIFMPWWMVAISLFNTFSYFASYQYGSGRTRRSWMPLMLLLQVFVAFYEGATLFYGVIFPPDKNSFDVIKKV